MVDISGMREGDEKTVRLQVRAETNAANALDVVLVEPIDQATAAAGMLTVSVGVVVTPEKRVPLVGQSVVRAPGYTMKVDHTSGVSFSLLDAQGRRRHGILYNGNFCYGIPSLAYGEQWVFRWGQPCRFVWEDAASLTACSGSGPDQVRLRYTFEEDCIKLALVRPTHPDREYTMWLGNFETLGEPLQDRAQRKSNEPLEAERFFFPHPIHQEGVLLIFPQKTPLQYRGTAVNFPMRVGQEMALRFATQEELPDSGE
jgi:hypothetical protein